MAASSSTSRIPWWAKIAAKLVLSRLPAGYGFWQRLGLFRHGRMDRPDYALGVFLGHTERSGLGKNLSGKTLLELGPGDSVASALIAYAFGARAILVDAGFFARTELEVYAPIVAKLREMGLPAPNMAACRTLDELLAAVGAIYLTDGLTSLASLPTRSIDLIYSQAVLEHVRRHEFLATQQHCARILKLDGVCSHRVDLRDHLGGSLNNLRFSTRLWESDFFAQSGFYTNRLNFPEMCRLFEDAGFQVIPGKMDQWDKLPIARSALAQDFREIPEADLLVRTFDVLLRHKA